jgi:hypothetical protein
MCYLLPYYIIRTADGGSRHTSDAIRVEELVQKIGCDYLEWASIGYMTPMTPVIYFSGSSAAGTEPKWGAMWSMARYGGEEAAENLRAVDKLCNVLYSLAEQLCLIKFVMREGIRGGQQSLRNH